jgi:ABC-2 type transport system permease protein
MTELIQRVRLHYRYPLVILGAMVTTDLKLRYQASVLGYLWTLLKPLALFSILYMVFVQLLRIGVNVPYYPVYMLFGIVLFQLFGEMTGQGLPILVARAELLRKIRFPRYVIVLSVGASVLITFSLNMVVIVIFMAIMGVPVRVEVLWLPLIVLELVVLALSMALLLSALYVRFRDLSYIWEVVLQAAFYAAPIIYPLSLVPSEYARFLLLNPLAQIIQDARYALITEQTETISTLFASPWVRLIPLGIIAVLAVVSVTYFRHRSPDFAEEA